jgi:hypothetical protein
MRVAVAHPPAARRRPSAHRRPRSSRSHAANARRWRKRGTRAQVSAIVTILGLLVIVSFIANYISTTLPQQMRVNDANHNLLLENQIGRLSSIAAAAAAMNRVGAVVSQPLSLGAQGQPPFAPPESGAVLPGSSSAGVTANFTVMGPIAFIPPGGWPVGGYGYGAGQKCVSNGNPPNPTTMTCSGDPRLIYNFTNGSHWVNAVGGANFTLQYTANWSTIIINTTGGLYVGNLNISGSHDQISIVYAGGAYANVTIYGNWDNISLSGTGGGSVFLTLVGNHDNVVWNGLGTSSNFHEFAYGQYDSTQTNSTSKGIALVYYTGFDAVNATSQYCPYGNTATTDTVLPGAGGTVVYNTTGIGNSSSSSGSWTQYYNVTGQFKCPFFKSISVPFLGKGASAGSFIVRALNNYAPEADVVFDEGATIYAQPGGTPVMINGPAITLAGNRLSLWIPQFLGAMPSDQGTGIASLSLRLTAVFAITLPNSVFSLSTTGFVTVTVKTPFGAAWTNYFNAQTAFAGDASCTGPTSACKGPYTPGGPVGTVKINIPLSGYSSSGIQFTLVIATYAISLR